MKRPGTPKGDPLDYIARYPDAIDIDDAIRAERERIAFLERQLAVARNALTAICRTSDSGPWIEVYRAAGGGYGGLQAIAFRIMTDEERRSP